MKLDTKTQVNIIEAYEIGLVPVIDLALQYHVSRAAIYKVLKKHGVDTSKRKIPVSCTACSKTIHRPRYQIRKARHLFCDMQCYYAYLEAKQPGRYTANRHGQRIGREVVARYFDLRPEHVTHHIDRNDFNNDISNLIVFVNQGDHIRYHRLGDEIASIFDGRTVDNWMK